VTALQQNTVPLRISVDELEKITKVIFKRLKRWNLGEIEMSQDFYWSMRALERYNPLEDPKDLTLGSLVYDLERLRSILDDDDFGGPYTLLWLAPILRFVGEVGSLHEMPNWESPE
jgi:hypothetical protein